MQLRHWLVQAFSGPAHFRFYIQPVVAILLGLRDGHLDAEAGKPPYLLGLFQHPETRSASLKQGLHQVATPFGVGIVIDAVVQYLLLHRIYLWMALAVGILLVGLPYAGARGLGNRFYRNRPLRHA